MSRTVYGGIDVVVVRVMEERGVNESVLVRVLCSGVRCVGHVADGGKPNRVRSFDAACVSVMTWVVVPSGGQCHIPTTGRWFGRGDGWRRRIHVGSWGVARGV